MFVYLKDIFLGKSINKKVTSEDIQSFYVYPNYYKKILLFFFTIYKNE